MPSLTRGKDQFLCIIAGSRNSNSCLFVYLILNWVLNQQIWVGVWKHKI
jgi:hypothetical protein